MESRLAGHEEELLDHALVCERVLVLEHKPVLALDGELGVVAVGLAQNASAVQLLV